MHYLIWSVMILRMCKSPLRYFHIQKSWYRKNSLSFCKRLQKMFEGALAQGLQFGLLPELKNKTFFVGSWIHLIACFL